MIGRDERHHHVRDSELTGAVAVGYYHLSPEIAPPQTKNHLGGPFTRR